MHPFLCILLSCYAFVSCKKIFCTKNVFYVIFKHSLLCTFYLTLKSALLGLSTIRRRERSGIFNLEAIQMREKTVEMCRSYCRMAMQATTTRSARTISTKSAHNWKRRRTKRTVQNIIQQRIRKGLFCKLCSNDPHWNLYIVYVNCPFLTCFFEK